jgi:eukaryotic-like serine/threonine-protein kinase
MKTDESLSLAKEVVSYEVGPILIDLLSRRIWRNGDPVVVPSKAFDALIYLVARPDRTISKEELISAVWKNVFVSEDSLFHGMSVLRRALGDNSANPQLIVTVPRKGYLLRGPVWTVFEPAGVPPGAVLTAAGEDKPERPIPMPVQRTASQWWKIGVSLPIAFVLLLVARAFMTPKEPLRGAAPLFTQSAPPGATLASGGILSPDGHYMVFVAYDQKAIEARLYLKQMDSADLLLLAGTEGASHPFWSPKSDMIGFFADGELKTVGLRGDLPKTIAAVPVSAGGGTWSSSGPILFSDWQTGLYRVDPAGGRLTAVVTVNRSAGELVQSLPQFLPDGRHFFFLIRSANGRQTGSYVGSLDSPERIRLLSQSDSPVIYSPLGYVLYVQDAILMAQRFDVSRLEVSGKPMELARDVAASNDGDGQMISASANLLTFRSGVKMQELAWFQRDGQRAGSIPADQSLRSPILAPDQKRLIAMDNARMWVVDLGRNAVTRLEGEGIYPLWSPDGNRIAFQSHDHLTLYVRNMVGPVHDQVVVHDDQRKTLSDWSPAGDYLVYATLNPSTKLDLDLLPMSGNKKPVPLLHAAFNESQGRIAPNGRWIAYVSDESGRQEIYVQRFPSLGNKQIVSIGGGSEPIWRKDGKELFYLLPNDSIVSVPFKPTEPPVIGQPEVLFRAPINSTTSRNHYAVTPDGQRFLIDVEDQSSYMSPITVVVDWTHRLETP